jgi:hypothetical protein
MKNFLIEYIAETGAESSETAYYKVQYSSKEKLIEDLTVSIKNTISNKEAFFYFLTHQMHLDDFNYYGAAYGEFDEEFELDTSIIMSLEEWFNKGNVAKEGDQINPELLKYQIDNRYFKSSEVFNNTIKAQNDNEITARLNKALAEMGLDKVSDS